MSVKIIVNRIEREIPVDFTGVSPLVAEDPPMEWLQVLATIWAVIERHTGFRWKATSWIRMSPSHQNGSALDIAPDISDTARDYYAVYHMSDPVLHKRPELIKRLQFAVQHMPKLTNAKAIVFVETDHLHLGLFSKDGIGSSPVGLVLWGRVKPVYPDSADRHSLPDSHFL